MRWFIYLVAIAVGLIDVSVKGFFDWNQLPSFVQGWSWHTFIFIVYLFFAWLIWFIRRGNSVQFVGVMAAFALEDLTFYVVKSLVLGKVFWNSWYFKTPEAYVISLVACLVASWILLKERDCYDVK